MKRNEILIQVSYSIHVLGCRSPCVSCCAGLTSQTINESVLRALLFALIFRIRTDFPYCSLKEVPVQARREFDQRIIKSTIILSWAKTTNQRVNGIFHDTRWHSSSNPNAAQHRDRSLSLQQRLGRSPPPENVRSKS